MVLRYHGSTVVPCNTSTKSALDYGSLVITKLYWHQPSAPCDNTRSVRTCIGIYAGGVEADCLCFAPGGLYDYQARIFVILFSVALLKLDICTAEFVLQF